jgi:hypothetical protein
VPSALYIWLVFAPGRLGRALGLLADLLDEAAPMPCPIYSRAVNLHAAQLNDSLGFNAVQPRTLECPSDLLVILPKQAEVVPISARPSVHIVRDLGDFSKIITVRAATYVAEQFCHFDEEFDGNDLCATHWLGVIDGAFSKVSPRSNVWPSAANIGNRDLPFSLLELQSIIVSARAIRGFTAIVG